MAERGALDERLDAEACLPYIDLQFGAPGMSARVAQLIQVEVEAMEAEGIPRAPVLPVAPPFSRNPEIRRELELVEQGRALVTEDVARLGSLPQSVEAPSRSGAAPAAWTEVLKNAEVLLEHQRVRLQNERLLEMHGKLGWQKYLGQLEALEKRVGQELLKVRSEVEALNRERKLSQERVGGEMYELERAWTEQARKNLNIRLACEQLEAEIAALSATRSSAE